MNTLGDRIRALREKQKKSQQWLADIVGVSRSAVAQWETGESKGLKPDNLYSTAKALGVTMEWLTNGSETTLSIDTALPPPTVEADIELANEEDYAFVPLYDVRASAGNGHPVEHELVKGTLAFQKEWLRANNLNVKNLSVIYAHGKSMEPRINDGDVLLIDASQRDIKDGKVYAIRWHGELRIKRLVRDYDGSVRIVSDNKSPDYPEQRVPADALGQLEIIGRVVWMGGYL